MRGFFILAPMDYTSIEALHALFLKHPIISKDSRNIPEGCIYFALKGERFDGNKFALDAIEKGAAYSVVDDPSLDQHPQFLFVKNGLKCLQDLGNFHRNTFDIPIIGITGSNGKTSTKELVYAALSQQFNTLATTGNYNNHIGVPLTLLEITKEHEIAIIEMGASAQGEIDLLCHIAAPNYGMITNIGKAHLEGFGGIEGVKKGKSEMYRYLEKNGGQVFINQDDKILKELTGEVKQIGYGKDASAYCSGILSTTQPTLKGKWKCQQSTGTIDSKLYGEYNFYNIMAAVCMGNHFGVPPNLIDQGINSYVSGMNRSQILSKENYTIYLDAYNANPTSMKAALDNFIAREEGHKYVVLGDMFEIGQSSVEEHKVTVEQVLNADSIMAGIFVGKEFYKASIDSDKLHFFQKLSEAKNWFDQQEFHEAHLLIKGSRGMQLEKLLD